MPALRAYLDEVMGSGILRMTDGARRVADLIGDPPKDVPRRPLWGLISFLAFQTLPDPLKRLYGVPGGPARRALLRASLLGLRAGRPAGPAADPLRRPGGDGRLAPGGPLRVPGRGGRPLAGRLVQTGVSARLTASAIVAGAPPHSGPRLRRTLPVGRAGTCGRKGNTDGADH